MKQWFTANILALTFLLYLPEANAQSKYFVGFIPDEQESTLVRNDGVFFISKDKKVWIRKTNGGVGSDLQRIFHYSPNVIFGVGNRAPLFYYENNGN